MGNVIPRTVYMTLIRGCAQCQVPSAAAGEQGPSSGELAPAQSNRAASQDSSQLKGWKSVRNVSELHIALQLQERSDREEFGTDNWTDARAAFGLCRSLLAGYCVAHTY